MTGRVTAFAPGRVNLIGEHTDYNGGLALPFAIARGITVAAEPMPGDEVEAHALDLGELDRFSLEAVEPASGWRAYMRGAVAELTAGGHRLRGTRVLIRSELPAGAGLASSAALTIAACLALLGIAEEPRPEPRAFARLCARVENVWAGAQTGLLDQLAILMSRAGHAVRLDTATLAAESVCLALGDWTLWMLDSGARHAHGHSQAGGGYNERRAECRAACAMLGTQTLSEASADAAAGLPGPLDRRVRHVLSENARVESMAAALRASDPDEAGRLLDEGHASLRDDYDVSVPAVENAVGRLRAAGASGTRMVGGGFGGHVLGLFPPGADPPPGAWPVTAEAGARLAGPQTGHVPFARRC
jgi:galactokinase